jgi:hypothetical protein
MTREVKSAADQLPHSMGLWQLVALRRGGVTWILPRLTVFLPLRAWWFVLANYPAYSGPGGGKACRTRVSASLQCSSRSMV